ncbi:ATP-binding protein [Arthrobacter sp. M4]|uniref:ATP-binding protein n=1 Tax=Arthrobacter sp. M4 TaxID=218160 RepID=UPI001CDC680F|nr:ATP-binding protein [Arthrobacter sp. M4]MCA4135476.1 ATP-binding protein [Arthrobacter sp. M4]
MAVKEKVRAPNRPRTLAKTMKGFAGNYGGRWSKVPNPPQWYSTSVQACGIYPFVAGSARPTDGAPLGRDMLSGAAVCMDHESLYRASVITSPSMFLYGINGVGKSSTAQTILLGQAARGITPGLFNPIKVNEHTALTEALGGKVARFGPGQPDRFNLLSSGPLGEAARKIGGTVGRELELLARDKSIQLVQLLTRTSRGIPLEDIEDTVLELLVDDARERNRRPYTVHLLEAFQAPSDRTLGKLGLPDHEAFHRRFVRLGETIRSMLSGEMGKLLGGEESVEFDVGNPGGFCFDTAAIPESNTRLLSAAMLASWSVGMDIIDAHWELAEHELRLVDEAAESGELYEPAVRWRGYSTFMDEFWYPLRACEGIVDRVDRLGRTNRSIGVAEMKATHSPKDQMSLRNPEDREKARGLTERCGLIAMMALTGKDLETLSDIRPMTTQEIELVKGFNAAPSWHKPKVRVQRGGKPTPPPGAGKVLFKVEGRVGIPVQMVQTDVQAGLHVTDTRFRKTS